MDRRAWKYHAAQAQKASSDAEAARTAVQRQQHTDDQPAPRRTATTATAGGGS
ncbi:hypothetical protein ACIPJN_29570 [Streptomyces sp. NPDC086796]|uniref:hypothetical protein n=1 Tax=Streptomyces sp. NPDC086796 TaxID=3365760 RepID=UPI003801AE40